MFHLRSSGQSIALPSAVAGSQHTGAIERGNMLNYAPSRRLAGCRRTLESHP